MPAKPTDKAMRLDAEASSLSGRVVPEFAEAAAVSMV
jgi:hypothetical protein